MRAQKRKFLEKLESTHCLLRWCLGFLSENSLTEICVRHDPPGSTFYRTSIFNSVTLYMALPLVMEIFFARSQKRKLLVKQSLRDLGWKHHCAHYYSSCIAHEAKSRNTEYSLRSLARLHDVCWRPNFTVPFSLASPVNIQALYLGDDFVVVVNQNIVIASCSQANRMFHIARLIQFVQISFKMTHRLFPFLVRWFRILSHLCWFFRHHLNEK